MIKHIVMWTLKDEAEGSDAAGNAAKMKEMLEALNGRINGLNKVEVSHEIVNPDAECAVILQSEHDDEAGLAAYAGHPLHLECVEFIKKVVSSRKAVDYRI